MSLKLLHPGSHKLPRHHVRFMTSSSDEPARDLGNTFDSTDSSSPSYCAPSSNSNQNDSAPGSPERTYQYQYQPAAQRFKVNEHRIRLLTTINQIVQHRAELESNRIALANLLDELKKKLKRRVDECQHEKKEKLKSLKSANQKLEKEKSSLTSEIEHLQRHLEKERAHHVKHARTAVAQAIQGMTKGSASADQLFNPCSISSLPNIVSRNVAKNAPSKLSDNKLAAARLMRDIAELRQRVATVEARLSHELKRKRQAEVDIMRLRKQLSAAKSCGYSARRPTCPKYT